MKFLWLTTREWGKHCNIDKTFPQYSKIPTDTVCTSASFLMSAYHHHLELFKSVARRCTSSHNVASRLHLMAPTDFLWNSVHFFWCDIFLYDKNERFYKIIKLNTFDLTVLSWNKLGLSLVGIIISKTNIISSAKIV